MKSYDLPIAARPTTLAKILGVSRQRAAQLMNPDEHRARATTYAAIRRGDIAKAPICARCFEASEKLHAHHWDYARPLEVTWYCGDCHRQVHVAMRQLQLRPYPWQTAHKRLDAQLTDAAIPPLDASSEESASPARNRGGSR
ncbi:MAG: hypothetical protein AB7E70_20335 [Hyphomicrobiaceae bacterium]